MKKELKNIIKGLFYSNFMNKPRFLYWKFRTNTNSKKLSKYVDNINKKPRKNKLKIAFILKHPEIWNSSKSVFEKFSNKENIELYIIAVPKDNGNPAYSFAKAFCKNVIDWDETIDYKTLDLDYVFYTRPYDKDYPINLKPSLVCQFSKLCYIPYSFEFVTGYHLEVEYNYKFIPFVYMSFCDGESSFDYCKKILSKNTCTKIYKIGFPRFDLLKRYKHEKSNFKSTVLWTPRWSLESLANDGTSFFEFIEPLITLFSSDKMQDNRLIIRPHPLMFDNFIKNNVMKKDDIDSLKNRIALCNNISFDTNEDYLKTAFQSDLIISDFSGMLIEFAMLNKPVIYCGRSDSFDATGKLMDFCMYHIESNSNICETICNLLDEGDVLKKKREEFIENINIGKQIDVGTAISNEIINDFRKNNPHV